MPNLHVPEHLHEVGRAGNYSGGAKKSDKKIGTQWDTLSEKRQITAKTGSLTYW